MRPEADPGNATQKPVGIVLTPEEKSLPDVVATSHRPLKHVKPDRIAIEIITHASAVYDASGNAVIINIRTKKNTNLCFNGNLSASCSIEQLYTEVR